MREGVGIKTSLFLNEKKKKLRPASDKTKASSFVSSWEKISSYESES